MRFQATRSRPAGTRRRGATARPARVPALFRHHFRATMAGVGNDNLDVITKISRERNMHDHDGRSERLCDQPNETSPVDLDTDRRALMGLAAGGFASAILGMAATP